MDCLDICDCPESSANFGPLRIDYVKFYCDNKNLEPLISLFLLLWVFFLIYIMGNTAKTYFSPTLGAICEKLKLSYDVAGVTFLAMGNGAPDLFGAVSSFTGGEDVLIGMGALLGGSVFVSTVVVVMIFVIHLRTTRNICPHRHGSPHYDRVLLR